MSVSARTIQRVDGASPRPVALVRCVVRSRGFILVGLALAAACGDATPAPATVASIPTPAPQAMPQERDAATECATEGHLPRTVLVERDLPQCPPNVPVTPGEVICLDALDGRGPSVIDRVSATATVRVAGTAYEEHETHASDARAISRHRFRFIRWRPPDNSELVTVGAEGEQTEVGGAGRLALLGGPVFWDATSVDGHRRAERQSMAADRVSPPFDLVLYDLMGEPSGRLRVRSR